MHNKFIYEGPGYYGGYITNEIIGEFENSPIYEEIGLYQLIEKDLNKNINLVREEAMRNGYTLELLIIK